MKIILKRIGQAVLLLVAILVVAWWILDFKARAEVEKAQAELRARGYPMSIEEIRPPPVPDEQNAALVMKQISDLLRGTNTTQQAADQVIEAMSRLSRASLTDLNRWTAEQRATIPEMVFSPDLEEFDRFLQEATARPAYNAGLKYEDGFFLETPNVMIGRCAIRYLAVKARLHAEDGMSDEAVAEIECAMKISLHLQNEPLMISQTFRFGCHTIVLEAMMNIADITGPAEWARFQQIALTIPDAQPFVRSLDGERICGGDWFFEKVINLDGTSLDTVVDFLYPGDHLIGMRENLANLGRKKYAVGAGILLGRPWLRRDYAFYLNLMAELEKAASLPYFKADVPGIKQQEEHIPRRFIVSCLLLPNLSACFGKQTETFALRDVCLAGLELKRYKAEQGDYPENLAALVPSYCKETPTDPFTGKPLQYRRADGGFVLYSVGPDLKDNGGTPKPDKGYSPEWDIVWISGR